MGSEFFKKLQYGKESTRGTAVAATKMLGGAIPGIPLDRKPTYPKNFFGVRSDEFHGVIHQYLVQSTLSIANLYSEALPAILGCALKGGVTASEATPAQGDYLWDFTPSETAANSPDSLTMEAGDDNQAYECEYTMFERLRVSGQVSQGMEAAPVSLEADFFARQWTATTFTGSLSIPTMAGDLNAKLARLYLDTSWAGAGGTEVTNALRGFDVEILTGVHPKFSGSAAKYFNTHGEGLIGVTGSFTLERNATTVAMLASLASQSLVVARLVIPGAQIGSGTSHNLTIDFSGRYEEVNPMAQADRGDNLDTIVIHGMYDATGAKKLAVKCTTSSNAY
jgi:hypothetical protein